MFNDYFDEQYDSNKDELYISKKDFQTFFPDKLYGKEGRYFFPEWVDVNQAFLLIDQLPLAKDQEMLFDFFDYDLTLIEKVNSWSYNQLTCSTLYFYINLKLSVKNLRCTDWAAVCNMIQSPAISRAVFCFVKNNNLMSFWSKEDRIDGFLQSLYCPPSWIYYKEDKNNPDYLRNLTSIKIHYRLLRLMGLEKPVIRVLIKITILQQNKKKIARVVRNLRRKI